MHHLHVKHEGHSPTYIEWLDIKAPYAGPTMEVKDVTLQGFHLLLLLIGASLYDLKFYEVLKSVVTSRMSPKNVA